MTKLSKVALILGLAGGLAGVSSLSAQRKDDGQDEGGVAGAIRYEKAKQTELVARQARQRVLRLDEPPEPSRQGEQDRGEHRHLRRPERVPPPERKPQ